MSTEAEIQAALKPIAPWWQWILGLMFFVGGVAGFPVVEVSPLGVVFGILVLVGLALVLYYFVRNRAVSVTMKPGNNCVLINDPTRPDLGELVPSKAVQEDDRRVLVYREGRRRELKRMEFIFANAEDTSKAMLLFKRFLPNT